MKYLVLYPVNIKVDGRGHYNDCTWKNLYFDTLAECAPYVVGGSKIYSITEIDVELPKLAAKVSEAETKLKNEMGKQIEDFNDAIAVLRRCSKL